LANLITPLITNTLAEDYRVGNIAVRNGGW
jgi:hypothetical protein